MAITKEEIAAALGFSVDYFEKVLIAGSKAAAKEQCLARTAALRAQIDAALQADQQAINQKRDEVLGPLDQALALRRSKLEQSFALLNAHCLEIAAGASLDLAGFEQRVADTLAAIDEG